jgi:small subunit ribosomal protein S20
MPIIKSAKKRVRVSAKAAARNAKTKRTMRETTKAFNASLSTGKTDKIAEAQSKATSAIDVAAKKNIIHKNKAARKKRQLSEAAKKAGATSKTIKKPATKATSPKPVKKTVAKKAPAKKLATNKITAKKATSKK